MLHLDHTKDFHLIAAAIECGFTSVMIDASEFPLAENAARTSKVVAYAHPRRFRGSRIGPDRLY